MRRVEDWLGLLARAGGAEGLLRPADTARERTPPLREALELAARTLGAQV